MGTRCAPPWRMMTTAVCISASVILSPENPRAWAEGDCAGDQRDAMRARARAKQNVLPRCHRPFRAVAKLKTPRRRPSGSNGGRGSRPADLSAVLPIRVRWREGGGRDATGIAETGVATKGGKFRSNLENSQIIPGL